MIDLIVLSSLDLVLPATQWFLAAHPEGDVKLSDIGFRTSKLPELKDGEVLVVLQSISVEPYQRYLMNKGISTVATVKLVF